MHKLATLAIAASAAAILLSAIPQGASPTRSPIKYGDRCLALVGREFYIGPEGNQAHQADKGPYRLVAVGVDFVEFECDADRVLMPLTALRITEEKSGK